MNKLSISLIGILPLVAGGCSVTDKLEQVGQTPPLTQIQNPTQLPSYQPVQMPMPAPRPPTRQENSLWQPGARAFFKDQRAHQVGDILTILISIEDQATINNHTTRERKDIDSVKFPNVFGLEKSLGIKNPNLNLNPALNVSGEPKTDGKGTITRNETIKLKVAGIVTQLLPNGNLVVNGRQEMRVNNEVRELIVAGVVRREDILADNTISYDKIAEARISYGGRGTISDLQKPRWGYEVVDAVSPF